MRLSILSIVMLVASICFAQPSIELFHNDARGRPLFLSNSNAAEGSPFLFDDYLPANLTVASGIVYPNVRIKVNLLEQFVQYLAPDGTEMITDLPVQRIVFTGSSEAMPVSTGAVFETANGAINKPGSTLYQVLDSGSVSLVKTISLQLTDQPRYGESNTTRIISRRETFCVLDANGLHPIGKSKRSIINLLANKKQALTVFINQNKLSCTSLSDYLLIVQFYNAH